MPGNLAFLCNKEIYYKWENWTLGGKFEHLAEKSQIFQALGLKCCFLIFLIVFYMTY